MSIAKIFLDQNMNMGIPGVQLVLLENKIDIDSIHRGTMFMFMNRKRTQVKILMSKHILLHFRKDGEQITVEDLKAIPNLIKKELFSLKIEKELSKVISRKIDLVLDEDGIKVG